MLALFSLPLKGFHETNTVRLSVNSAIDEQEHPDHDEEFHVDWISEVDKIVKEFVENTTY
jgi:hypothetical protein